MNEFLGQAIPLIGLLAMGFVWGWAAREAHANSKALFIDATDDEKYVVKYRGKEIARDVSFADAIHAAMMHNAPPAQ